MLTRSGHEKKKPSRSGDAGYCSPAGRRGLAVGDTPVIVRDRGSLTGLDGEIYDRGCRESGVRRNDGTLPGDFNAGSSFGRGHPEVGK